MHAIEIICDGLAEIWIRRMNHSVVATRKPIQERLDLHENEQRDSDDEKAKDPRRFHGCALLQHDTAR